MDLVPYVPSVQPLGGNTGGAGSTEGIQDNVILEGIQLN